MFKVDVDASKIDEVAKRLIVMPNIGWSPFVDDMIPFSGPSFLVIKDSFVDVDTDVTPATRLLDVRIITRRINLDNLPSSCQA